MRLSSKDTSEETKHAFENKNWTKLFLLIEILSCKCEDELLYEKLYFYRETFVNISNEVPMSGDLASSS